MSYTYMYLIPILYMYLTHLLWYVLCPLPELPDLPLYGSHHDALRDPYTSPIHILYKS